MREFGEYTLVQKQSQWRNPWLFSRRSRSLSGIARVLVSSLVLPQDAGAAVDEREREVGRLGGREGVHTIHGKGHGFFLS